MLHLLVTVKQVIDPETPLSAFSVENDLVVTPSSQSPVINGFDEQAIEASLRLKETLNDVHVTVISVGANFALDVIKKPLAMGADELILIQDPAFENNIDPTLTITALVAAIRKLGSVDLVLAGRQASDWDNGQVPLAVAESLGWPSATVAKSVTVEGRTARVQRVLPDGHELVELDLPAVITVSNELGTPRYPNMRGIMSARRVQPVVWSAADIGIDVAGIQPAFDLIGLAKPTKSMETEFIVGDDDADAGRKLALRLRESRIV